MGYITNQVYIYIYSRQLVKFVGLQQGDHDLLGLKPRNMMIFHVHSESQKLSLKIHGDLIVFITWICLRNHEKMPNTVP